jgi:hypothetical protein
MITEILQTLPGDFDLDHQVGVPDLITWAKNFGTESRYTQGDSNFDGLADVPDLITWAKNFGKTTPGSYTAPAILSTNAATAIPEPTSLAPLALATMGWLRRKKRKPE